MAGVTSVNVRDIARACDVSAITVSRALRGEANVAAQTRDHILKIASQLGYVPNPLVKAYASHIRRSRSRKPTCNLAWLNSTPENHPANYFPWVRPFLQGAQERAANLGYALETDIQIFGQSESSVLRILRTRGVRGVIVPHIHFMGSEVLATEDFAAVSIGYAPKKLPLHTVATNAFENTGIAMQTLHQRGFRRIGLCENIYTETQGRGMYEGSFRYHQSQLPAEHFIEPLNDIQLADNYALSRKRFEHWFYENRPEAILTTFYHVFDWLKEMKVSVPREVYLAHLSISEENSPWSGINIGARSIGSAAIDLLAAHINRNEYGIPNTPKQMALTGTWQDGDRW